MTCRGRSSKLSNNQTTGAHCLRRSTLTQGGEARGMAAVSDAPATTPELKLNKHRIDYSEWLAALVFILPFVVIYGVLFVYPTIQMLLLSLQNAPLIGPGKWVGVDNYLRLFKDRLFSVAVW